MLLLTAVLLVVVLYNGLGVFWPAAVAEITLADGTKVLGEPLRSDRNPDTHVVSVQFKTGNREFDPERQDFRWYQQDSIQKLDYPTDVYVLERMENGNLFGYLKSLTVPNLPLPESGGLDERFAAALGAVRAKRAAEVEPIAAELSSLSDQLQGLRYAILKVEYRRKQQASPQGADTTAKSLEAQLEFGCSLSRCDAARAKHHHRDDCQE
jgi:phosphate transport system permease protein